MLSFGDSPDGISERLGISVSTVYNYHNHKEIAQKHLEVGNEYTFEKTEVDSWHTDVWLQEFPNVKFNSVFLEDALEQSEEMDKQHPDYWTFQYPKLNQSYEMKHGGVRGLGRWRHL